MSSNALRVALVVGLAGCGKKPAEAPGELADLGLFLFQHFEDEDPAEMAAGLQNLSEMILSTDLTVDAKDRAVTMPILEGENLGGLSIPDGVEAANQIPIAIPGESIHPIDDQLVLVFEPNQVCIESETTQWAQREFLTDTACFEDLSCDRLEISQEVYKSSIAAKVWYDQFKNYRWFDLEDDEGTVTRALVGRSWTEEEFFTESGNGSWEQLFHLDVYIENPTDPGTTLRWFSLWSSIDVSTIGDDFFASLAIDGINDALVWGDEFISGNIESCKNDRDLAKPPRE